MTFETIAEVVRLLGSVPSVVSALASAGRSARDLVAVLQAASKREDQSVVDQVVSDQRQRLDAMLARLREISSDSSYDAIEIDSYRARTGAQVCKLLKSLAPVKDRVPDYELLTRMFCSS